MLAASLSASSLEIILSIILIHGVLLNIPNFFKRLCFWVASSLLAFGFSQSFQMSVLLCLAALIFAFIEKGRSKELMKKYILLAIVMAGNWLRPGLPEIILSMLSIVLFLRPVSRSPINASVVSMWSITFIALLIAQIGDSSFAQIELIACSLLLASAISVAWTEIREFDSTSIGAMILIFSASRTLIEGHLSSMGVDEVVILTRIFQILYFVTIASVFLRNKETNNNIKSFAILSSITFLMPFTPDALPLLRETLDYSIIFVATGLALMMPLAASTRNSDRLIFLVIGLIVVAAQLLSFRDDPLSRVTNLGLIAGCSTQVFFIFKECTARQSMNSPILSRERLPQYLYLLLLFGGASCLWYILSYVRQIQG